MKNQTTSDLGRYMERVRQRVDSALDSLMPPEDTFPTALHKAMRYSVFSGGKRFRPVLCIAAFEALGGEGERILPAACAIELVHAYSLIHDDLPCMDDDDLRRGKPTSHKVFGEAVAVLAGDALVSLAVEILVKKLPAYVGCDVTIKVLDDLLTAIGSDGMVGGQVVDITTPCDAATPELIEYIHSRKTGCLISSSLRIGGMIANGQDSLIQRLSDFGKKLGLAFQVVDDILDARGCFGDLKAGSQLDRKRGKPTYPAIFGLDESERIAQRLIDESKAVLDPLGERGAVLKALADFAINRKL